MDATWEAWRRVERGISAHEPTLLVDIEIDSVTIDPRPEDLAALNRIQKTFAEVFSKEVSPFTIININKIKRSFCL